MAICIAFSTMEYSLERQPHSSTRSPGIQNSVNECADATLCRVAGSRPPVPRAFQPHDKKGQQTACAGVWETCMR